MFFLIMSSYSYAQIEVIDDTGQLVSLEKPAQIVISLSPGLTELIYAAGGSDKIKAAVSYSDFPEQAKQLPRIGNYDALDIEQILQIKPDLIIAWKSGNPVNQIAQLQKFGLNIYISEPLHFNDIPETIKKLGKLMGSDTIAQKNTDEFIRQLNALKKQYTPLNLNKKKTTFIQIWNNPLMSINDKHLISKVISFCGGHNIFSQAASLTYSPDIESVLKSNPEIIIATGMAKQSGLWLKRWQQWPYLSAVKNKRLYSVNPDHLVRHTPRILSGIKEVCELIQPAGK
ncbi:MAG: cobalamin-binding protein [gamma proteobacterium symbiont of Taylorina sp.]|nr:cobalamin-binding protein [gamma proteobacterium symbiont of Taylorina sp.]